MKLVTLLSAALIALAGIVPGRAQLIEAQNFDVNGNVAFNITLTVPGPINVMAVSATTLHLFVDGVESAQGRGADSNISALNYVSTTNLSAGPHTVTISGGGTNPDPVVNRRGAATLIALNEPSSGTSNAIATLASDITALQASQSSDSSLIAQLQSTQVSQTSQINALIADEQAAATHIAALQCQLTTIQNTLQCEINNNTAAIVALQHRADADEAALAQQQAEIAALQNLPNDPTSIITLQQQQSSLLVQQQADEATLSQLQNQLTALQSSDGDHAAAITDLQQQQTVILAQLQADQASFSQLQGELAALQSANGDTATALAALQQQLDAVTDQQQANQAALATLQGQQAGLQASLEGLQSQLAQFQSDQAAENAHLQSQITALQHSGSSAVTAVQSGMDRINRSNQFTRTLTYAGIGLGLAGLGTGIGAIISDDDSSSAPPVDSTDPKADVRTSH